MKQGRASQCCDEAGNVRKGVEFVPSVTVRGGIGAGLGIKKFPEPKSKDRNKRGHNGEKLKKLAGQNLPWYQQRNGKAAGGLQLDSSADGNGDCPEAGWSGALQVGVYGEVGALITAEGRAFLEWKFGTPFTPSNIDARLEGSLGFSPSVTAQVGLEGVAEGVWIIYLDGEN